jgi:hypothetical protein
LSVYNSEGSLLNSYETSTAPRRVSLEYSDGAVSVNDEIIANKYELEQNYPNPFNPTTTIQYSIPKDASRETSNVSIIVYDIVGNEVKSLVNEKQSPGNYSVQFDAGNLASGVYYYRLQAGNFSKTMKMMLIK